MIDEYASHIGEKVKVGEENMDKYSIEELFNDKCKVHNRPKIVCLIKQGEDRKLILDRGKDNPEIIKAIKSKEEDKGIEGYFSFDYQKILNEILNNPSKIKDSYNVETLNRTIKKLSDKSNVKTGYVNRKLSGKQIKVKY